MRGYDKAYDKQFYKSNHASEKRTDAALQKPVMIYETAFISGCILPGSDRKYKWQRSSAEAFLNLIAPVTQRAYLVLVRGTDASIQPRVQRASAQPWDAPAINGSSPCSGRQTLSTLAQLLAVLSTTLPSRAAVHCVG